ncbi:MAG: zf-HC2 domain-containing protein [Oscillospiraceae bacterium]|nr:zf-HC2 domain-containing protein [Oscillospiraceae bacterium]
MDCKVIQDLLPLYVDGCCSEESGKLVEAHAKTCSVCAATMGNAKKTLTQVAVVKAPKLRRVGEWKASMLQSLLFLLYFGAITAGVTLEAATPRGATNGLWAFNMIIPATGALLALMNWYFLRLYGSRRAFVIGSVVGTAVLSGVCFLWGIVHYEVALNGLVNLMFRRCWIGIAFMTANLILSLLLSHAYAKLVGKE